MKQMFVDVSFRYINKDGHCDERSTRILKYGLEGLYSHLTKTSVLVALAIILGLWKEVLLSLLFFLLLRTFGFGIHAKTSLGCWLTTIPVYIGGAFFVKYATLPIQIVILIWIIGFLNILIYAPADTHKRPLIRKHQRIRNKVLCTIVAIVYGYCIIAFNSNILTNVILFALILQTICIHPLTYKLCKSPYDNYKTYKKKEV